MIISLIIVVMAFIIAFKGWGELKSSISPFIFLVLGGAYFQCMGTLSIFGGQVKYSESEYKLGCLADTQGTKGSFFLGSGVINEIPVYAAYLKRIDDDNNEYSILRTFSVKKSRVYEDQKNIEAPRLIIKTKKLGSLAWTWGITSDKLLRYEFHIPPNSITNQFRLDAE